MAATTTPRLALRGITKQFGDHKVLKGVDLTVAPGEFIAIVGRSGCGKSTLLRIISQLDAPTSGTVEIDGQQVKAADTPVKFLFQEPRLLPWKRIWENVALFASDHSRAAALDALRLGIASVALTGSVLLVQGRIAAALTNDPELQQLCREYLSVNLVFCWGIFLQTYGQRLLQAVGDTVLSMVSLIIGAVANIILDPMMIFGLLGCPAMGIRGAAIATVIGQLIGAAAALWFNRVKNPVIHVRLKGYRFLWQDVADIYRVGLPTIVMQAIGSVMTFAVNGILLGVSSTAVAFFGIYYKLQNFLMMPVNGLGQAAIPVVGFNYGSGQSDRVKQAWEVLLPTGVVFALCGTAVFLLFPAQLLGLFSAGDEMLAFGVPALRIISVTFLFAVTTILCGYFASGLGNGVVNMIGGALRQLVVLVPCLWLLIRTMGIDRVWFAFWVSEVIACAYSLWATKKELRNKGK